MQNLLPIKNGFTLPVIGFAILLSSTFNACHQPEEKKGEWESPASADNLKSPIPNNVMSEAKGKDVYNLYCLSCHGEYGFGDGAAGASFDRRPANFHNKRVRAQTNGSLFWKITNGRMDMPSFERVLSEEQRWQVVSYVRKISVTDRPLKTPVPLRNDIQVEHFMTVDSLAVRILLNSVSGNLWYTTFDGNVFEIITNDSTPVAQKKFSAKDHGITKLQGAVFLNNTIFLSGNTYPTDHKTNSGRMVCYNLDSLTNKPSVIFNTAPYPANKTVFDHGWNALEISPDKKFIYVNSGSRTDHGEVQDNGGQFPNARDNALTAKIFRFPINARNLFLPDDRQKLLAEGYIYAEGIRNAYDMAFDKEKNLFAVSNSPDYDMPEDMFWIRPERHYGFPWIMGGIENPQQYPDWIPDPSTDPFIPKSAHAWRVGYFNTDTGFPKIPAGIKFTPGVQNTGPDANEYRGHSGKILDGDQTGIAVSTFTAHCSPLGLCFDTKRILAKEFNGDGFVIRYSSGARSFMMQPFTSEGTDLLHLHLTHDSTLDNYFVRTVRIVDGFNEPTDAVLVKNHMYVIEYGGKGGNIWKITLPMDEKRIGKNKSLKKTQTR